LSIVM